MDNEVQTTAEAIQTELPLREEAAPATEEKPQVALRSGYLVGVKEDGQFVFDVTGTTMGVIELLGLHAYAARRIENLIATNQGTGDAISMQILARLDGLTAALKQLLSPTTPTTVAKTVVDEEVSEEEPAE